MNQPLTRLVFAGEAIVDLLMWVPALPERGGDMLAESSSIQVGAILGAWAARLPELSLIPAPAVVAIDTTGAGHAHSGVFLAGLPAALPPSAAARRAAPERRRPPRQRRRRAGRHPPRARGITVPGRTRRVPGRG